MAFEYKFDKKKSDVSELTLSAEELKEIRERVKKYRYVPEDRLKAKLKEKDEMILRDCEIITGLEQEIEMLQCLIETKDKVIANLNKQIELQNNLNDLIKKMQENREKKD